MPLIRSPLWSDPRRQPRPGSVEIDWTHPLAQNLAFYVLPAGGGPLVDLVRRERSNVAAVYDTNALGVRWRVNAGPDAIGAQWRPRFGDKPRGTALVILDAATTTNTSTWLIGSYDPATGDGWLFRTEHASSLNTFRLSTNNFTGSGGIFANGAQAVGVHTYVVAFDATASRLFRDAVQWGPTAGGVAPNTNANRRPFVTTYDNGFVVACYYYEVLDPNLIFWLSMEPYSMLRPIVRRRWFVPAAGTPVSAAVAPSWEAAGGVAVSGVAAWEALAGVRTSSTTAYEGLASATRATGSPWEALAGLRPSTAVPWEAGGVAETPVSSAVASPWEALRATSRTSPMPWESLVRVSVATAAPWEALITVTPGRSAGWEALAGTSAAPTTSWEAVRAVSAAVGVSWEATGAQVTRAIAVPWEAEGGAAPAIRSRRLMVGVGR